jgi:hypothetical protein
MEMDSGRFSNGASIMLTEFILNNRDLMIDNNTSRTASASIKRDDLWMKIVDDLNLAFPSLHCTLKSCKAHWSYKQSVAKSKNAKIIK